MNTLSLNIRRAGATVEYLPAYSPDLNPIKKRWSKIKAILRAGRARTSRALNAAIRRVFRSVTSDDARSWFVACGFSVKSIRPRRPLLKTVVNPFVWTVF